MTFARSGKSGAVGRSALLATLAGLTGLGAMAAGGACTLTHPLDEYHAGNGAEVDAAEPGPSDASISPDGPVTLDGGMGEDAGDGCQGTPQIITPVSGSTVGASVHLTASAPRCLTTMILYIDGAIALHLTTSAVDQDVPIAVGTHRLNINGWAGTAHAHSSPPVLVTRTK